MTDMTASILIKADATQAPAALRETTQAVKGLGGAAKTTATDTAQVVRATDQMTGAVTKADTRLSGLGSETATLRDRLDAMGGAAVGAAGDADGLAARAGELAAAVGGDGGGAAEAVEGLVAQFGDLGGMSIDGLVEGITGALTNMLAPLALVQLGVQLAGELLLGWLMKALEDGRSFDDTLSDLNDSINALNDSAGTFSPGGWKRCAPNMARSPPKFWEWSRHRARRRGGKPRRLRPPR